MSPGTAWCQHWAFRLQQVISIQSRSFTFSPVQPGLSQSPTASRMQTSWYCSPGNSPFSYTLTTNPNHFKSLNFSLFLLRAERAPPGWKPEQWRGNTGLMRFSSVMLIFQCLKRVVSYIVQFCSFFQWTANLVSLIESWLVEVFEKYFISMLM